MTELKKKPTAHSSLAEKELEKVEGQFKEFDEQIKSMTLDRMNMAPKEEKEEQNKIASRDLERMKDTYLKPTKIISPQDKFNEKFRESYEFDKEYVQFIAENNEIVGETIDIWTRPYGGMSAEYWQVPCNKPVWGPRYLAEQIKRATYHRLIMQDNITGSASVGKFYGSLAVDTIVNRLDARPVSTRKSIFMGSNSF